MCAGMVTQELQAYDTQASHNRQRMHCGWQWLKLGILTSI